MKKQSYQRILAVLISLMILLTAGMAIVGAGLLQTCLLYTSPSPRDPKTSRMPSSA